MIRCNIGRPIKARPGCRTPKEHALEYQTEIIDGAVRLTTAPPPAADAAEVARLREQLRTVRMQLKHAQRLASVGTLTAMVVHEFNNILTPIVNYAQLAERKPNMVPKALRAARTGGQRATDICQAILGIAACGPAAGEAFSLGELLDETLAAMARDPGKDRIELDRDIPPGLLLSVKRIELQQVLLNLLINARAAVLDNPGPRRVRIAATAEAERVVLTVADNGCGIPPENLKRIFEPFFSTKTDDDRTDDGNGLGLAICKEIIAAMDGKISVDSAPGEGATFTITLPRRVLAQAG